MEENWFVRQHEEKSLINVWLVVSTPLKNMSVGIIILNIWKNNPNVPNHQPDVVELDVLSRIEMNLVEW